MSTIFTKIISGEIPAYKVAENENYLAFLDVNPLRLGHTLVIPKVEVDYIFDLDDFVFTGLHLFAKKVAKALENVVECKRIGVAIIGLEVPHAHIHLCPMDDLGDLDFTKNRAVLTKAEFETVASKIKTAFDTLPD